MLPFSRQLGVIPSRRQGLHTCLLLQCIQQMQDGRLARVLVSGLAECGPVEMRLMSLGLPLGSTLLLQLA